MLKTKEKGLSRQGRKTVGCSMPRNEYSWSEYWKKLTVEREKKTKQNYKLRAKDP